MLPARRGRSPHATVATLPISEPARDYLRLHPFQAAGRAEGDRTETEWRLSRDGSRRLDTACIIWRVIRFPFNERKAAQVAALILRRHAGAYSYIGLIKLMYLADRRALVETGMPLTGDDLVSMQYGPVLSKVKDCMTGWQGAGEEWLEFVSRSEDNEVRLLAEVAVRDELSDYEVEVLEAVDTEFGHLKPFDLVEVTHKLPEWRDPSSTAIPIDPADILRAEGVSAERIKQIEAEAAELVRLDEFGASGL